MYDYIFVVLVYRNTMDLMDFLESANQTVKNYKVIIVNSYYDEQTKNTIEQIAKENSCDFINVENKGYSFGNNVGIEYATRKYQYKYLIVSNPDIIIKQFDFKPDAASEDIIAPCVIAASGKHQNPMMIHKSNVSEWLIYHGFKKDLQLLWIAGVALNRLRREIGILCNKERKSYPIYCAHGSFLLLSRLAVEKLGVRPYDENMFLFAEESVLAQKAQNLGLKTIYYDDIRVFHKEDGSMKLADFSLNNELKKANIYYYENYIKEK